MPQIRITTPVIYPKDKDISKVWFIKYRTESGKLVKLYGKLSHYKTLPERLAAAKLLVKSIKTGTIKPPHHQTLIRDLSQVLEDKKATLRPKSYQTYISILVQFTTWYRKQKNEDKSLNAVGFLNYLREEKKHNNYIRKCINLLRSLFDILLRKKRVKENPFFEIRVKKIKAQSKLPFHANHIPEIKKITLERNPQLWDAVEFLYYLYFRPGEVRKLRIEHILFEDLKVIASDDVTKDKDNYLKVIPLPMMEHIQKYKKYPPHYYIFGKGGEPGTKQVRVNYLCSEMTKILRELNYSRRYTLYSFVHTGIKNAAMSQIPIVQLQLQKGHSDLKMFSEYLKDLGVEDCSQLIRNFPAL